MEAVNLVYEGWSTRKVARHFGFASGTVSKWVRRDQCYGLRLIPTRSSCPRSHPHALGPETVSAVIRARKKHHRCAEVVHRELAREGVLVSLSSVKRTLARHGLIRRRSPWKRLHRSLPRPEAQNPGDLVQVDTLHIVPRDGRRFWVYTLLDVVSRWAYARVARRMSAPESVRFIGEAQRRATFQFRMLQSDHGPEFSTHFTEHVRCLGMAHRHSRVRQANDNGHVERFNRTVQEECLRKVPTDPKIYQRALTTYLPYYNGERLHLGLNLKTPLECVQAID